METPHYHTSFTVKASPKEVYKSINNVTAWWSDDFTGTSEKLNDEFTVRFGDIHVSSQKLIELIPEQKVVWLVTDSKLNFIKNKDEWTNTKIIFEISADGHQTKVDFIHIGLIPSIECYPNCSKGWEYYIGSLFKLLTEGKGTPGL